MNKKLLISIVGALMLGIAAPSLAGPDWQAIEQARKAKQAAQVARHGDPYEAQGPTSAGVKCPPQAPTLLLDHGPRAQGTPYLNRQRQQRYEVQLQACRDAGR